MLMLYIYFFYLASQAQTLIMGWLLMLWAYSVDTKSAVSIFIKLKKSTITSKLYLEVVSVAKGLNEQLKEVSTNSVLEAML